MELLAGEKKVILAAVQEAIDKHGGEREKLIPVLQEIQNKIDYLPPLAMEKVADETGIPAVDVFGLTTFYNQFRLNPPGMHQLKVCMGTACYMTGGSIAMESFIRHIGIKEGETTRDRHFSLERVACVGCCSLAPVVVIDEKIEARVTPTRVDGIMLEFEGNGITGRTADEAGPADSTD